MKSHTLPTPISVLRPVAFWCVFGGLVSCASPDAAESLADFEDSVRVRPRVVIDGLLGLAARTEGRLFVDRVAFHAPGVQIRNDQSAIMDLLPGDAADPASTDPLFFVYDAARPEAAGSILGGERQWQLAHPEARADSRVVFEFAPLAVGQESGTDPLAAWRDAAGIDLSPLRGYTAFIHGQVAVPGARFGALTASGDLSSGDPEGDPATPAEGSATASGDVSSGDPEGDPAHPAGPPAEASGDTASGDPEGDPASGDPEGDPASGDPEGDPASGDPEGDPAKSDGARYASLESDERTSLRPRRALEGDRLVPFFVVLDARFELPLALAELGLAELGAGEYLAMDLHVDVDALFSDDRLAELDQQLLRGAPAALLELGARDARGLFDLGLREARSQAPAPASRIQVRGDGRGR